MYILAGGDVYSSRRGCIFWQEGIYILVAPPPPPGVGKLLTTNLKQGRILRKERGKREDKKREKGRRKDKRSKKEGNYDFLFPCLI